MSQGSEEIEFKLNKLLADRSDSVVDIAMSARAKVISMAGECEELLYSSYAVSDVFTFTGKLGQAFVHIVTYANHVNLGFNRGAKLDDPEKLLCGTGKLIRHVRLESKSTVKKKVVTQLIRAAIQQGRDLADHP